MSLKDKYKDSTLLKGLNDGQNSHLSPEELEKIERKKEKKRRHKDIANHKEVNESIHSHDNSDTLINKIETMVEDKEIIDKIETIDEYEERRKEEREDEIVKNIITKTPSKITLKFNNVEGRVVSSLQDNKSSIGSDSKSSDKIKTHNKYIEEFHRLSYKDIITPLYESCDRFSKTIIIVGFITFLVCLMIGATDYLEKEIFPFLIITFISIQALDFILSKFEENFFYKLLNIPTETESKEFIQYVKFLRVTDDVTSEMLKDIKKKAKSESILCLDKLIKVSKRIDRIEFNIEQAEKERLKETPNENKIETIVEQNDNESELEITQIEVDDELRISRNSFLLVIYKSLFVFNILVPMMFVGLLPFYSIIYTVKLLISGLNLFNLNINMNIVNYGLSIEGLLKYSLIYVIPMLIFFVYELILSLWHWIKVSKLLDGFYYYMILDENGITFKNTSYKWKDIKIESDVEKLREEYPHYFTHFGGLLIVNIRKKIDFYRHKEFDSIKFTTKDKTLIEIPTMTMKTFSSNYLSMLDYIQTHKVN